MVRLLVVCLLEFLFDGDAEYAVQNICVYLLEYLFFYFMLAWSGFCDALAIRWYRRRCVICDWWLMAHWLSESKGFLSHLVTWRGDSELFSLFSCFLFVHSWCAYYIFQKHPYSYSYSTGVSDEVWFVVCRQALVGKKVVRAAEKTSVWSSVIDLHHTNTDI